MSVNLMSLVFKCNVPELKTDDGKTVPDTTAKFVLLALADNANDEGEGSYPGVDTLCKKTNFSTATVCNALNALRTNGFTELVGKSKFDTNNYTILVAKILEFQWLKRDDFSGYNPSVLATKTNPSYTSVKPSSRGDLKKITESANKTVDAILEQAKQANGKTWTKLPAPYDQYAKAFCEATGLSYQKKYFSDWCSTFDEWMTDGIQPADVTRAIEAIRGMDNPTSIHRPGSITWKLRAQKVVQPKVTAYQDNIVW